MHKSIAAVGIAVILAVAFIGGGILGFNYATYNAELVAQTDTGYLISYSGITHYYE